MKHNLILCALFFTFMSCKDEPEPAIQLLINTDMEAGATSPNAWWDREETVYTTEWTTEEASSGIRSLKISATESITTDIAFWAQTYVGTIPVGKDIILSIEVKCKNVSGDGISIVIRSDNGITSNATQLSSTQGITSITGDFDWTTYDVRLNGIQSDIKSLTVYFVMRGNTTGTVYFDNASLMVME